MLMIPGVLPAQQLAGTDGLGRVLPQYPETGGIRKEAQVAMFYFMWQGDKNSPTSPDYWDLSEIQANHPEVFEDFNSKWWGGKSGSYYFWGEPVYGYYRGDDYWVHLKNMQLLTDAGVDLVVLDATNRLTYVNQVNVLMKAAGALHKQGKTPPKIVFYTNTKSGDAMQEIYDNFYKPGAPYCNPDCWYILEEKPLIIGVSEEAKGREYEKFFTIRESQWPTVEKKVNGWPWIEFVRPQKVYSNHKGEKEIINVSVAQHPDPAGGMGGAAFYGNMSNWGRSYRNNSHGNPEKDIVYGYNFQEQWDVALQERPPFVFVTGWNEWIAGRWPSQDKNPEHSWFCDQANPEYSRDIEPSFTSGLEDHYYMQLVANIRRYKGMVPQPVAGAKKKITAFGDWKDVTPVYSDYTGDVLHRNHPGAQSRPEVIYKNESGRNDFDRMKVARDNEHIYFYARTVAAITPVSDDNWMSLYLDTDRSAKSGWHGYDYRVIRGNQLQVYKNGRWSKANDVASEVRDNEMMIRIPYKQLAVSPDVLNIEFKWSDNCLGEDTEPLDWYVNGDAAPGGRFNYVYKVQEFP